MLESTYGDTHSHVSMGDARTNLYNAVERALKSHNPVLIPTFSVGRAQMLALLFAERLKYLPQAIENNVNVVLDGMAQEATQLYHAHVTDETYVDESIVNLVTESGVSQPFLPDQTVQPDSDDDRERLLDGFNSYTGENIPLILAPSGMLTGGHSPRYLTEFAARYDEANVFLTGYQANGTTGRALYNAVEGGADSVTVDMDTGPFGTDWPESDRVQWTTDGETGDRLVRVKLPVSWVDTVGGLSGHAARHGLRDFAHDVSPETIGLVHGSEYAQNSFAKHLAKNISGIEQATRSRLLTPIPVSSDISLDTAVVTPDHYASDEKSLYDQLDHLHEMISALGEEVADVRNAERSEQEIRALVRDELREIIDESEALGDMEDLDRGADRATGTD